MSSTDQRKCNVFFQWYGHKPGVEPSVTAGAGTSTSSKTVASAAAGAPQSVASTGVTDTTSDAGPRVSPRKRKVGSIQSAILNVVKEMSADNKRMEEERLKVARQMHSEDEVFRRLP